MASLTKAKATAAAAVFLILASGSSFALLTSLLQWVALSCGGGRAQLAGCAWIHPLYSPVIVGGVPAGLAAFIGGAELTRRGLLARRQIAIAALAPWVVMTCLVLLAGLENDAALLAGSTLAGVSVIAVLVLMGRLRRDAPSGGDSEKVWGGHSAPFLADGIEGMAGTRGRSGTGGIWSLKQLGLMVAMWYVLLYALTLVFAVVSTLLPELESMAGPASYAIGIATTLFILFVFVWRKGLRLRQIGVRPFCPQAWVLVLAGFLAVRSLWAHVKWSLVLSIGYSSGYETNRVPSDLWRSFSDTVGTGLVAPLIEELVFRGILFKGLVTHIGPKKGALLSALVYSLAHILLLPQAPYVDVNGPQLFMLCFSGLLLAGLYHDTGSIWPGVVLHGAFNLSLQ